MKQGDSEELVRQHRPEAIRERLQRQVRQSAISDVVLGGIDGCVTTFAVVSGTVGAGFSSSVALVLGFANLLADGFSMAISNYESIKARREFRESVRTAEQEHIERIPAGEREEIRQIFQQKGFSGDVLERIVDTISGDPRLWVDTMLMEEHGMQKDGSDPLKAAAATFAAFICVGAVPLTPFMIPALEKSLQFPISACLAGIMFFSIGTMKSLFFTTAVIRSGLSTLLTGGAAAGLAFLVGHLLKGLTGVG